jgi:GT2 family glycosyltransferase
VRASVVIPTFNRLGDLQRVVASLEAQAALDRAVEIVVVDDGSTDGTHEWLAQAAEAGRVTAVSQDNSGPAVARNRGVEAATGDLVLFLGDDTVPRPGWLQGHLEAHRLFGPRGPLAVLGYTTFPSDEDSPFRRFINEYGAQFGYLLIEDPCDVPFNFFYTSNISLPRSELVRLGGFREDFPAAAWEDIEFAYRAVRGGLRIRYEPRARTLHEHCIRPRTFCRRQRTSGRSAAIFSRLHPELGDFLGIGRLHDGQVLSAIHRALLWLLVEAGERVEGVTPWGVYRRLLDDCYLRGLAEGLQDT